MTLEILGSGVIDGEESVEAVYHRFRFEKAIVAEGSPTISHWWYLRLADGADKCEAVGYFGTLETFDKFKRRYAQ